MSVKSLADIDSYRPSIGLPRVVLGLQVGSKSFFAFFARPISAELILMPDVSLKPITNLLHISDMIQHLKTEF